MSSFDPVAAAAARHAASEAAKCAHTETGLSVLRAALHNVFGHGEHGLAVKIFVNKEKAEVELVYTEQEVALADCRDAIEAECDRLIAAPDSGLAVIGSCKHTKHAQLDSVAALDALRIIKPKKSKKTDMFEFEFVVGATAKTLDKKRRDDLAAVNSKKTSASVEKAAAAKAASAASPSPVAAASPTAASSAAASSSNGAAAGAAATPATPATAASSSSSGDYVVETTQAVYRELALPSFARALLLGQVGAAAAASESGVNPAAVSADALAAAAALLTPDQQSGLLSRAQLKELKDLAPECRPARVAELAGAERLVAALTPAQLESSLPAAARAALRADLLPALESYMIMFANQAYTRGFQAAKRGNGNIDLATLL